MPDDKYPPAPPMTVSQRHALMIANVTAQMLLGFCGEYGTVVSLNGAVAAIGRLLHVIDSMLIDQREPDQTLLEHHALGLQLLDDLRKTWQQEYDAIAQRIREQQQQEPAAPRPIAKTPRKVM